MSRDLCRDIYDLKDPSFTIEGVKKPNPDPLAASRYSCVFWADHMCDSKLESSERESMYAFLKDKYLYWLKALSLEASIPKGITSKARLNSLSQVCLHRVKLEQRLLTELVRHKTRIHAVN